MTPRAILSEFPEVDFCAKGLEGNVRDILSQVGPQATSRGVERIFDGVDLYIKRPLEDDNWEMHDLE
jgi:hypothetical protein